MVNSAKSIRKNSIRYEDDYNPALHPEDGYGENGQVTEEARFVRMMQQQSDKESKAAVDLLNKGIYTATAYNSDPNVIPYKKDATFKDYLTAKNSAVSKAIENAYNFVNDDKFMNQITQEIMKGKEKVEEFIKNNPINSPTSPNPYLTGPSASSGSSASANSASSFGYDDLFAKMKQLQDENNAWNAEQAQKQMDFQERMARNSYTYAVEDLKNAGLNPVLAAGASGGAATPNGSSASADTSATSAMLQLAMMSLDAMQNTAVAYAAGTGQKKGLLGLLNNKNIVNAFKSVGSIASSLGSVARLFGI